MAQRLLNLLIWVFRVWAGGCNSGSSRVKMFIYIYKGLSKLTSSPFSLFLLLIFQLFTFYSFLPFIAH